MKFFKRTEPKPPEATLVERRRQHEKNIRMFIERINEETSGAAGNTKTQVYFRLAADTSISEAMRTAAVTHLAGTAYKLASRSEFQEQFIAALGQEIARQYNDFPNLSSLIEFFNQTLRVNTSSLNERITDIDISLGNAISELTEFQVRA